MVPAGRRPRRMEPTSPRDVEVCSKVCMERTSEREESGSMQVICAHDAHRALAAVRGSDRVQATPSCSKHAGVREASGDTQDMRARGMQRTLVPDRYTTRGMAVPAGNGPRRTAPRAPRAPCTALAGRRPRRKAPAFPRVDEARSERAGVREESGFAPDVRSHGAQCALPTRESFRELAVPAGNCPRCNAPRAPRARLVRR